LILLEPGVTKIDSRPS